MRQVCEKYVVFAVRQVCEKYLAKGKQIFWAIMELDIIIATRFNVDV